jgi:hypothetical protein
LSIDLTNDIQAAWSFLNTVLMLCLPVRENVPKPTLTEGITSTMRCVSFASGRRLTSHHWGQKSMKSSVYRFNSRLYSISLTSLSSWFSLFFHWMSYEEYPHPPPVTCLSWVESTCKYRFPNVREVSGFPLFTLRIWRCIRPMLRRAFNNQDGYELRCYSFSLFPSLSLHCSLHSLQCFWRKPQYDRNTKQQILPKSNQKM